MTLGGDRPREQSRLQVDVGIDSHLIDAEPDLGLNTVWLVGLQAAEADLSRKTSQSGAARAAEADLSRKTSQSGAVRAAEADLSRKTLRCTPAPPQIFPMGRTDLPRS